MALKGLKALINLLETSGRKKRASEDKKSDHIGKMKGEDTSKAMWQANARPSSSCGFCDETEKLI